MDRTTISKAVGKRRGKDSLPLDAGLFLPGDRVCIAVSGGADSTALLRLLVERRAELGIVLSVLHVEHGLRGDAAKQDTKFVVELATHFDLACEIFAVDTPARVAERKESVEQAARNLRYEVFRTFLTADKADKVATAHTLNDQAETVLLKMLRGAWTEGLSGIHPVLSWEHATSNVRATQLGSMESGAARGCVIRPFLSVQRFEIETYLRSLGQIWREDETNQSPEFTRNRVRHELLPVLRTYNPQIEQALAHMAANARTEEQHWQAELSRVLPRLLLEGKPVRGGGRRVSTAPGAAELALEIVRLQALDPGLRRRVLRATAERCGAALDFAATEKLLRMVGSGSKSSRKLVRLDLPGVSVESSARELQFEPRQQSNERDAPRDLSSENLDLGGNHPIQQVIASVPTYRLPIPGEVEAPAFHTRYIATVESETSSSEINLAPCSAALVRAWRPGDRVTLRYSSGPKKVKEVLERMGIRGDQRKTWPVIEWQGRIIWMRGVELFCEPGAGFSGSEDKKLKITELPTTQRS